LNRRTPTTFSEAKIGEEYDVIVELAGHTLWEKKIKVTTRDDQIIAKLEEILVKLTVTSNPEGAAVYLNGSKTPSGSTPLTLTEIAPKIALSVEVRKEGYKQVDKRSIDWTEDTEQTVPFELVPSQ
jgi:hypothetical protein